MSRTLALAAAALALAACTPDFDPASKVEKLRVLAVQADPPEIEPASATTVAPDRAALHTLVLRADFDAEPARTTTVVHVACIPTPGDPAPSPCVTFDALRDQTAPMRAAVALACTPTADADVVFAGVEVCAAGACGPAAVAGSPLRAAGIAVPARVAPAFAALRARPASSPKAPELALGVQAVVLAFAVDASPEALVALGAGTTGCAEGDLAAGVALSWASREHVLSTKRVVIRGPDAPDDPNQNPAVDGIAVGATVLDPLAPTTVPGGTIPLATILPAGADTLHQQYTKLDADGDTIESTREDWVTSWFSTAGEIDELHTRGGEGDEWKVSGAAGGAPALVAAVVRDLRGGVAWTVRRVRVVP
jgi:hypothetical protein